MAANPNSAPVDADGLPIRSRFQCADGFEAVQAACRASRAMIVYLSEQSRAPAAGMDGAGVTLPSNQRWHAPK